MTTISLAGPPGPSSSVQPEVVRPVLGFDLLESKLQPPWSRSGLVHRTSLVDRLLEAQVPIVAVVAPPGYGKTTLLAQWSERTRRRAAWVSLDERDDDPGVLLSYLASALDRIEAMDPAVLRSLLSPVVGDPAAALRRLAVAVSSMREPFVLFIDHVESIGNRRCLDAIAELAVSLPAGSQLALASRSELPIATAKVRARGLVLDVVVEDLAMDEREARALLAAADVELDDDALTGLVQRTEGWPVGLYLAALAVKAERPRSGLGLAFTGDDRLMADYLRSEVLADLTPMAADFLMRTSVLDHLSGPVCDAVMGGANGSQRVLESLESSNLLLVPLDRRREWYRCHHLLLDLLRTELVRSEPTLVPELHVRAARWFEANGRADLAIEHAQAAGDADRAARIFAGIALLAFARGRVDTVYRWSSWFEARGLIEEFPQVATLGALAETMQADLAGAERWAEAAAAGSCAGLLPDGSPIESWIAVLDAVLCRRGVTQMQADAELACARLSSTSPFRGPALFVEGSAHLLLGDIDAADPIFAHAAEVCFRIGAHPSRAAAVAQRAVVAIERHDWPGAELFARQAVGVVEDSVEAYVHLTLVYAAAARVAAHRGDIGQAKEHVAKASRFRPLCSAACPLSAQFLLQLAHAYLELADPAGARAVLRQVREILELRPDLGVVPAQADELEHMLDAIRLGTVGASSLTAAELRLLPLLATHLSYRDIGERLYVSRNTVKSQAVSLFRKLGVSSRSEAIERAEEIGLLGR